MASSSFLLLVVMHDLLLVILVVRHLATSSVLVTNSDAQVSSPNRSYFALECPHVASVSRDSPSDA